MCMPDKRGGDLGVTESTNREGTCVHTCQQGRDIGVMCRPTDMPTAKEPILSQRFITADI